LRSRVAPGWTPRVQSAITTATSEPEPDVAIVRGEPRDYLRRHPGGGDIALVVEVADSSLARDRAKVRIYAAADIRACWIVNLVDECVEVYSQPDAGRSQYMSHITYSRGEDIPLIKSGILSTAIAAADVLP
jgi:Uma2 family endonuclease